MLWHNGAPWLLTARPDSVSPYAGDLVWARCEYTCEEGFKPVVHLFRNTADTLVHLSYRRDPGSARRGAAGLKGGDAEDGDDLSATITGTDEHPFWSLTRGGWIAMGELKPGERLLLAGGQAATATAVRIERLAEPVTVYNFEVADWHTYHVGAPDTGWVWVHNKCGPDHLARQQHIMATAGGQMERRVPLTNGRYRIADNIDAAGRIHQVGVMRTRGGRFSPSARERAAIEDIRKAQPNATIIFHDKFNKGPSLINPDLRPGWRPAPRKLRYDP